MWGWADCESTEFSFFFNLIPTSIGVLESDARVLDNSSQEMARKMKLKTQRSAVESRVHQQMQISKVKNVENVRYVRYVTLHNVV